MATIGIAGDMKGVRLKNRPSRERAAKLAQPVARSKQALLFTRGTRFVGSSICGSRKRDERRQRVGNLHARKVLYALRIAKQHRKVQAEVRNMGKRTAWIEGQRRQVGKIVS